MVDLNFWQPGDDLSENYINFKHIHEELAERFTRESGENFGIYEVEHVFWFAGGNPFGENKPISIKEGKKEEKPHVVYGKTESLFRLPDSYVPPIISILPLMAINDEKLNEAAKASATSLPRAFEKSINAAFTLLGYETKLLGQGQGRVPDGIATDIDNSYALIWDGKIRNDKYSLGTDDRTIKEYITTQGRELRRKKGLRNIYYVIISGSFTEDFDDVIRSIKMETDINEVVLMEAEALVGMVDLKLRSPLEISLGPDGIQRLFTNSGVQNGETVREMIS